MTVREQTEDIERRVLSPRATLSAETKGRDRHEEPHPLRTDFQRDRDRILHSKAFRRLKHKTQVFISPEGDHYRVRLTHTLEVSQIARTVARGLRLNEDLTEAIALGHDLGHTPFGHLGEEALTPFLAKPFKHNEQSLRVVDHLENDGEGLNLTWEVRDGILNHPWATPMPATLEGQVARFADRIAYVNHDVDDAVRAGIITAEDVSHDAVAVLGATHPRRIDTLVTDLIEASEQSEDISLSPEVLNALTTLREFLFDRVYLRSEAHSEQEKAISMVRALFSYYLEHPEAIPAEIATAPGDAATHVADYIAGMTDRFALRTYEQLFLPQGWLL
ncbi:MAG TPA: deoxyguanosinetriphosphate triphosphohydrolase [Actinomycetota bacterium]|nr:deoxyguanosinetriphosphate triphosphohydrolase [Actinomycetota bacterium]